MSRAMFAFCSTMNIVTPSSLFSSSNLANRPWMTRGAKPSEGRIVPGMGWADDKQIGIDQGPIVLMIENWRSGFVWNVMRKNPYVRKGLERAGFTGGWLDQSKR